MSNNITERPDNSLDDKVEKLIAAVQSLDTKVDRRLRETQPIWEAVQARLSEIIESQRSLVESQQRLVESHERLVESHQRLVEEVSVLRAEVASLRADTEKGFRTIDRRMERQLGEFERLYAYQRDLEDRIDRIEKLSSP